MFGAFFSYLFVATILGILIYDFFQTVHIVVSRTAQGVQIIFTRKWFFLFPIKHQQYNKVTRLYCETHYKSYVDSVDFYYIEADGQTHCISKQGDSFSEKKASKVQDFIDQPYHGYEEQSFIFNGGLGFILLLTFFSPFILLFIGMNLYAVNYFFPFFNYFTDIFLEMFF